MNDLNSNSFVFADESFTLEQIVLDNIVKEFNVYIQTFEEFLYADHSNSMEMLRMSEKEGWAAAELYEKYRQVSKDYGALKSQVYNLEEQWRTCKLYQRFLYLVSPMEWRQQNDFYLKGTPEVEDEVDVSQIFGRFRLGSEIETLTIEDLIGHFLEDVEIQEDPKLYFQSPEELLNVYNFIEIQNLNLLLHLEELSQPLENIKEGMHISRKKFDEEMEVLQDNVDSLEGGIM